MMINQLYCGNNLPIMRKIESESIDLIYADPPYFTQKDWGDFDDRFEDIGSYIAWLRIRMYEMKRLLKPTGSIYVHCDWHAGHYIKVMMDDVFGYDNFQNDVIWSYKRWTAASKKFQRLHDNLLFYSKGIEFCFNAEYAIVDYADNEAHYTGKDDNGEYRWQYLKGKKYKLYKKNGVRMGDVWEIPYLNSVSKERMGYQTQKPEALLERIINISSNPGDVVLDPFCGSGTACAVAKKLGRKYIGIDKNPDAIKKCNERISSISSS